MEAPLERVPSGPLEKYRRTDDLLEWMGRQFKSFGDTFKASVYGIEVYATRDVEYAHHVLVENWRNYVKGHYIKRVALLLGNGLMVSKGELWKRQRRMIQPAFNHESIRNATKLIVEVNIQLLKKWQLAAERGETVNVTRDISGMVLESVLRFIFGEDYDWVSCHFDLLSSEPVRNIDFARSFRNLERVILHVADKRRSVAPTSVDVLGMLLEARDMGRGKRMSDEQLVDEILTLIVAGHETTSSTLNWTWYLISQHPEVEERLSCELKGFADSPDFGNLPRFVYTRQVIDEAMRLYPAGWLVTRRALQDDRLGEYFVPAGTEIYISPYFIQRHPNLWNEPDRFNPDRFSFENSRHRHRLATLPFSSGPRNCIGASFARVQMQIHLMTIARHLRLRYVPSGSIEVDAGVNLRSKADFLMQPEAKASSKAEAT